LSAGQRSSLGLVVIEGLSHREAAEILEITEGAGKSHLAAAREALQTLIPEPIETLQAKLRSMLDKVLDEPVPERLVAAAHTIPRTRHENNVIPLRRRSPRQWAWPRWGAVVASLIVGVLAGQLFQRSMDDGPVVVRDGRLLAGAALAHALSHRLRSDAGPPPPVGLGISFRAKSGNYCRTFQLRDESQLAGLACKDHGAWHLQVLARSDATPEHGSPDQDAEAQLPPAVLQAVEEQLTGEPLDARMESAARATDWNR
jgi:hypothetical protein